MNWLDVSQWYYYNPGTIIFYFFFSLLVWGVCLTSELRDKVKYPKLVGVSVSLVSGFEIGVLAFAPMLLFLAFSWLIPYYVEKFFGKDIENGARKVR